MSEKGHLEKTEREIVLDILVEHEIRGTYSNQLIRNAQDRYASLPLTQRSFIKRLSEGTIEREMELDGVIRRHQKNPGITLKPAVRCLLRMSIYQIYYMDSVPDFAACNEAVQLCRKKHLDAQAGFVNGVLRAVCREKTARESAGTVQPITGGNLRASDLRANDGATRNRKSSEEIHICEKESTSGTRPVKERFSAEKDPGAAKSRLQTISETWSMPEEIVRLWTEQLDMERTESLCRAMLEVRPVCIRLNAMLQEDEKGEVLRRLEEAGVTLTPGKWMPDCYYLGHVSKLADLPGFRDGKWTVQDESSQLVLMAAGLVTPADWQQKRSSGDVSVITGTGLNGTAGTAEDTDTITTILDLCAAPGGKTMLAAELVPDGHVFAYDLTKKKTDLIRSNLGRMKIHNVTVAENDASNYNPSLDGKADLVLCDVPCSGLGVMTKKRDIKYNFSMKKIHLLTALQKKIVTNAARAVKPGGILIYSTCTIDRLENEKIADYIAKLPGMKPDALAPYMPEGFPEIRKNQVQMFPDLHGTDGFFIARFRREQNVS